LSRTLSEEQQRHVRENMTEEDKPIYQQKCTVLFEHVYESYPERDAGVYAGAG
jgi:hypothetical protein